MNSELIEMLERQPSTPQYLEGNGFFRSKLYGHIYVVNGKQWSILFTGCGTNNLVGLSGEVTPYTFNTDYFERITKPFTIKFIP